MGVNSALPITITFASGTSRAEADNTINRADANTQHPPCGCHIVEYDARTHRALVGIPTDYDSSTYEALIAYLSNRDNVLNCGSLLPH